MSIGEDFREEAMRCMPPRQLPSDHNVIGHDPISEMRIHTNEFSKSQKVVFYQAHHVITYSDQFGLERDFQVPTVFIARVAQGSKINFNNAASFRHNTCQQS